MEQMPAGDRQAQQAGDRQAEPAAEATPGPNAAEHSALVDRVAALESLIEEWAPVVRGLVDVSVDAAAHNHSIGSILSAVAHQLFGFRLPGPRP